MIYGDTRSALKLATMLIVASAIGGGIVLAATRAAPGTLAGADRARVEATVRAYVLANPEIIPEAMKRLQERESGKVVAANSKAILQPFGNAWIGNPNADVTLVEYFDYNCGYCRSALPAIEQLVARDPNVKVVFREWPILSEDSVTAAKLSLAAAEQGRFKQFHDALYAAGPVSAQTLQAAAKTAGLDMARATAMTGRAEAEIASNRAVAQQLGLTGTPSWVIGNKIVSAALPLEELEKAVKEARAASPS